MANTSRISWLFLAPGIALLTFLLNVITVHSSRSEALRLSAGAYEAVLAALQFLEDSRKSPGGRRALEVSIALIGFCISASFVIDSLISHSFLVLRFSAFGAIASGAFLLRHRTDLIRGWVFALMAVVMFHRPVAAVHPLYVSISVLSAAAAAFCITRTLGVRTMIRRTLSVGALLAALMTAMSIGAFKLASQAGSTMAQLVSIVGILFFGIGTLVIITRGDWFERHSKHGPTAS